MRFIAYVVGILAVCALAYFALTYTRPISAINTGGSNPRVTTATIHEETPVYAINVKYPQFGIPAIDADIKHKVEAPIEEFKSLPSNPPDSATSQITFDGSFDSAYIGSDVVSVRLVLSQYTGGAHPITLFSGLNYNRTTGAQLLQNDAFTMVGMTIQQVSAASNAQLKAKLGDGFQFPEGASTNPENFSSFVISADKVTFIFQEYQVAAYAAGPQQVSFPRVH